MQRNQVQLGFVYYQPGCSPLVPNKTLVKVDPDFGGSPARYPEERLQDHGDRAALRSRRSQHDSQRYPPTRRSDLFRAFFDTVVTASVVFTETRSRSRQLSA